MGSANAGQGGCRVSTCRHGITTASAGSLLSGDCLVELSPGGQEAGIALTVESTVLRAYGERIRTTVLRALNQAGISCATVKVRDRGALDFVLEARVKTAAARALSRGDSP